MLKKSTRYCIVFKYHLSRGIFFLLMLSSLVETHAQIQKEYLAEISTSLEILSDSLVPGLKQTANFSVVETPVQDLLRAIAEAHSLNISVDPSINIRVTNNFTNVQVKDLLLFICEEYGLDIRFSNTIMSFVLHKAPEAQPEPYHPKQLKIQYAKDGDRLSIDLASDSVTLFAKQLTQVSGKNVILAPGVSGKLLSGFISEMEFEKALDKVAYANNLVMTKTDDNFFILSNPEVHPESTVQGGGGLRSLTGRGRNTPQAKPEGLSMDLVIDNGDTLLALDIINVPIAEVVKQVSATAGKNYVFFSEPQGSITAKLSSVTYEALLSFLLQGTTHTFKKIDGICLIGERTLEGFRTTTLVRLQFRAVQDIEKIIPAELVKGVDIKVFPELNALILSGGTPQINEIQTFLRAIDQPVSNILIEVIVVEARKGAGVRTGIKAGIRDSLTTTGGQLFPGIDFTFSSRSINDIVDKINGTGVLNLGKVAPNFYATLQAMEENNQLDIQSTPKLSTLNGHEANLSIGQSRYYLEQTQNITGGVTPINSVSQRWQKVDANLAIKILPAVAGDEHITLKIEAEFSDFIEPVIQGAPPGNATRKFISQIRVRNEEMIVLGGLEEARNQKNGSGVPLLSRIPVLKWIFSSRSTSKSDARLIIFIKPTIVY